MTTLDHSDDRMSPSVSRIWFSAAAVGLIPGLGYFGLFACAVFGVVDWVGLLGGRYTTWLGPLSIGGLVFSILFGLTSGAAGRCPVGLRACAAVAVVFMVLDVSLMLIQMVSFFEAVD